MEQMKNQCSMEEAKMNLTRSIAKMMALGWYEYEQAKEDLAMPERIEHNKRMRNFYDSQIEQDQEKENKKND